VLTHENDSVATHLSNAINSVVNIANAVKAAVFHSDAATKAAAVGDLPSTEAHEAAANQAAAGAQQAAIVQQAHAAAANAAVQASKATDPKTAVAMHPSLFQRAETTVKAHPVAAVAAAGGAMLLAVALLKKRRGR